ncbi:hypothetical protein ACJX0J_010616, partial [Zea mays]
TRDLELGFFWHYAEAVIEKYIFGSFDIIIARCIRCWYALCLLLHIYYAPVHDISAV